jgi:hypothetical protein
MKYSLDQLFASFTCASLGIASFVIFWHHKDNPSSTWEWIVHDLSWLIIFLPGMLVGAAVGNLIRRPWLCSILGGILNFFGLVIAMGL